MMQASSQPSVQRGLTLIELLITLTLVGALLIGATPSLRHMVQYRRLDGVVQTYLSQLHWARQQAVAMNQPVHLMFGQTAESSCYLFYIGERDRCACGPEDALCTDGAQALLAADLPATQGIQVASTSRSTITVDALRGTVTPTFTAVFSASNGQSVRASTSVMGRTRTCSPAPGGPAQPACT